jgi:hypothetical protein
MFDGTLSFDRVLMPASQASTALRPPSTTSWSPSPCKQGEARFEVETWSPSPCKQGEASFGLETWSPSPLQAEGGKFWGTRSPAPDKQKRQGLR